MTGFTKTDIMGTFSNAHTGHEMHPHDFTVSEKAT